MSCSRYFCSRVAPPSVTVVRVIDMDQNNEIYEAQKNIQRFGCNSYKIPCIYIVYVVHHAAVNIPPQRPASLLPVSPRQFTQQRRSSIARWSCTAGLTFLRLTGVLEALASPFSRLAILALEARQVREKLAALVAPRPRRPRAALPPPPRTAEPPRPRLPELALPPPRSGLRPPPLPRPPAGRRALPQTRLTRTTARGELKVIPMFYFLQTPFVLATSST